VTEANARVAANAILISAAAAAAYVVITTPPLRRLAGRAARAWLAGRLPAFLLTEVRTAWVESARTT
jgi:hypothetical protein